MGSGTLITTVRRHSPQMSAFLDLKGGIMYNETFQNCFDKLQKAIANAEAAGKIPFVKKHIVAVGDPQVAVLRLTQ